MTTGTTGPAAATTPAGRMAALGRAELTLLRRNRTALATALLLPAAMIAAWRPLTSKLDLGGSGLDAATLSMSGGVGFILLFVVYYNVVTAYVARREDLVLKRLRAGEPTDAEILAGTALPSVAVALAQCAALAVSGAVLLRTGPPHRPDLLVLGLVLGVALLVAQAAVSTVFTETVELAQLTTAPLLVVSAVGSGFLVPLDLLPDPLTAVCRLLPFTPVMELVQAGWQGGDRATATHVLASAALAMAWTAATVFAVRRWFRWEPRR